MPKGAKPTEAVRRVRAGLLFRAPVPLPRGPHGLGRDAILSEQRERLLAATTELMAARGYANVTIGAIVARSKVSRSAFYESFADKQACAFAAYDRFIEVLLDSIATRAEAADTYAEQITGMLDAYFAILQDDPVAARAFLVEMDALGTEARGRRRTAMRGIAHFLRSQHKQSYASGLSLTPPFAEDVYVAIVYAARQLACDALDEQPSPNLRDIGDALVPWLLATFQPSAIGDTKGRDAAQPS
jgi:AcrR family transcriptional regulator